MMQAGTPHVLTSPGLCGCQIKLIDDATTTPKKCPRTHAPYHAHTHRICSSVRCAAFSLRSRQATELYERRTQESDRGRTQEEAPVFDQLRPTRPAGPSNATCCAISVRCTAACCWPLCVRPIQMAHTRNTRITHMHTNMQLYNMKTHRQRGGRYIYYYRYILCVRAIYARLYLLCNIGC